VIDNLSELLTLLATFVGSAVALARYSLNQHRAMVDRFVTFLESSLRRQEETNARFQAALEDLTTNVRRSSQLLSKVAKRLDIPDDKREGA